MHNGNGKKFKPATSGKAVRQSLRSAIACAVLVTLWGVPASWASDGEQSVKNLVKVFAQAKDKAGTAKVYGEAARFIDYRAMSQLALGEARWQKLSNEQKSEFVADFRQLIEKRYYPRWQRIFAGSALTYVSEEESKGLILVKTKLNTADSAQLASWTLSRSSGSTKVVNLTVGTKDLIKRAAIRFDKKLAKASFEDFLAWLKKEGAQSAKIDSEGQADNPASG
jgi:ABC-type transporter MlaC component